MSAIDSSGDSSLDDSESGAGRNVPEDSRRDFDQAGNALNDRKTPQILSPTAPAWLPADLAEALSEPASGDVRDHSDVIADAFCQGGPLDEMPPGPTLAAFLTAALAAQPKDDAATENTEPSAKTGGMPGLTRYSDNALLGLIRGWRRVASQAAAAELAAVAEFTARRHAEAKNAGEWDSSAVTAADTEIGAALTLTSRSTHLLIERATMLRELPATAAALAAGQIDMPKALVFIAGLNGQDPDLARTIEAQLIDQAPAQTTGKLRAAVNRALIAADPDAAERRRDAEEKQGRIERDPEGGGTTASLAGRYLPVPATVAAWNNITTVARELRRSGASGTLDELRVQVYLALLSGQAVSGLTADGNGPGEGNAAPAAGNAVPAAGSGLDGEGRSGDEAGDGTGTSSTGSLTGSVNLTVPLVTLLGLAESPGALGGFGPVTAFTARDLAVRALDAPAVRWCVTVTDETGQPIAHGCAARKRRSREGPDWTFTVDVSALAGDDCTHTRESRHYRPSPLLRHLLQIRNQRCTAPGCRNAADRCDDDHTRPYDQGGRTCECNLGPLCRYHHRVKQSQGWRLEQPAPGIFVWVTPSGRTYTTGRETYAALSLLTCL